MKITSTNITDGFHEIAVENSDNVLYRDGEPQGCRRAIIPTEDLDRWSEGQLTLENDDPYND